ncbi:MAG: DUF2812 domain-containing protein [Lachnospiraceae bacterium]|nr:DUF2812 domain-containing protein [Lachnospiraceae bacterium]
MRKIRVFMSFMKERDWLEQMAARGWLLRNITLGMLYRFEPTTPCEKVYEIDRFAITSHSTIADLTAKTRALDIASQFGWQLITHDEDMNYYFVKDKAGDETDEFYDDEDSRRERAERYRRRFCVDLPSLSLLTLLTVGIIYLALCFFFHLIPTLEMAVPAVTHILLWSYFFSAFFFTVYTLYLIHLGGQLYSEFNMSRTEWEKYRSCSEKKRFTTLGQLRFWLEEKSASGFALKEAKNGRFYFEETSEYYQYFIDTKANLKKRLKKEGLSLHKEKKDWYVQSLNWYAMSLASCTCHQLEPVTVMNKAFLLYRRPLSGEPSPWENDRELIWTRHPLVKTLILFLGCYAFGYIVGFVIAFLTNMLMY